MKTLGGAKKRSLKKIEKQQRLQAKKQQREQRRRKSESKVPEKKIGGISIPNLEGKDLTEELSKMKAITPYVVASRYDIKLSTAKNMLEMLERRGLIQLVTGNTNLKLYRFGGSVQA